MSPVRWLRVPAWIAAAVLAGWVADLLVPGFRIDGSVTSRLVVGAVVATISFLALAAMALVAGFVVAFVGAGLVALFGAIKALMGPRRIRPRRRRLSMPHEGFDDLGNEDFRDEASPTTTKPRWHPAVTVLVRAGWVGMTIAITPLAFFLGVRACQVVGAPVEVSGGWAVFLAAGLVVSGVGSAVRAWLVPPTEGSRLRRWAAARVTSVAVAAVLWLAVAYVDGIQLAPADGHPAVVDVLVLAAILDLLRTEGPGLWGAAVQGALNVLALWFVAWVSVSLASRLEFSGPLPLVLTALVITAVTLPQRLLPPAATPPSSSTMISGLVKPETNVFRWRQRSGEGIPEWHDGHA